MGRGTLAFFAASPLQGPTISSSWNSEYDREAVSDRFFGTIARPSARSPRYDREASLPGAGP